MKQYPSSTPQPKFLKSIRLIDKSDTFFQKSFDFLSSVVMFEIFCGIDAVMDLITLFTHFS
jgi:hypothetical protein